MKNTIACQGMLRFVFIVMWLGFVPLFISGCAGTDHQAEQKPAANPEESLKATAEQYWKMRMEEKYEDIYKMEEKTALPPFEKYREQVMAMRKLTILKHEVKEVKVDNNAGTVKVEFYVMIPPAPKPFVQTLHDYWTYTDGTWLHRLPPE
jgi:hypothetical protein